MSSEPLAVIHVLDALTGTGPGLWGKERLVSHLMVAQRDSGEVEPALVTFSPCSLADEMRERGFDVDVLEPEHRRLPWLGALNLRRILYDLPKAAVVHSHEYKANVVSRLLRRSGARMSGLVSTSHAWFDETRALRAYNILDRQTAFMSDVTTVADRNMIARFPRRGRFEYVANGLPDRVPPAPEIRAAGRARLGIPPDRFAIGFLARTNASKGIPEVLEAARRSAELPIIWVIGGAGDLDGQILAAALPNVRYVGYVSDSDEYRSGLDVYLQASRIEGLSLSLLEAMRAGLPIVATDAGSTSLAVANREEALVIPAGDAGRLLEAVMAMANDREFAARLGRAARQRFGREFRIDRQHRDFLRVYRSCPSP